MNKETLENIQAPEFITDKINSLTGQGPQAYRHEAHRRQYLYNTFTRCPWATNSLIAAEQEEWKFQELYVALDAAWLLHEKADEARQTDNGVKQICRPTKMNILRRASGIRTPTKTDIWVFCPRQAAYEWIWK